jgi:tetratricopeptide (TPR) repeat protein
MNAPEVSQAEQYLNSGHRYLEFGNYSTALHYFEQAIALNPELAEAWEGKASTLRQLGRHEEVIAASEQAIALRTHVVENNAWFWCNQGKFQFKAGDFEEAITSFHKSIEFKPDNDAFFLGGVALAKLKRYGDAIASFDKAIKFKLDDVDAWYNRGVALRMLENYGDAIASFDKAIKFKPNNDEAPIQI